MAWLLLPTPPRLGPCLLTFLASAGAAYTYADFSVRAHIPQLSTQYSGYPAGIELLFDVRKLYSRALGSVFEEEHWGPLEYTILAKHYERHDQRAFAYHAHYLAHLASSGHVDGTKPPPPGAMQLRP